jgi:hypothetical protein
VHFPYVSCNFVTLKIFTPARIVELLTTNLCVTVPIHKSFEILRAVLMKIAIFLGVMPLVW